MFWLLCKDHCVGSSTRWSLWLEFRGHSYTVCKIPIFAQQTWEPKGAPTACASTETPTNWAKIVRVNCQNSGILSKDCSNQVNAEFRKGDKHGRRALLWHLNLPCPTLLLGVMPDLKMAACNYPHSHLPTPWVPGSRSRVELVPKELCLWSTEARHLPLFSPTRNFQDRKMAKQGVLLENIERQVNKPLVPGAKDYSLNK